MLTDSTASRPPPRRVLVVDDHTSLRQLWADMLRLHGYAADVAADGLSARDKIAQQSYDAIVCELHMPGLGGRALFDECLQHHPQAAARFVFISGGWYADTDELVAGTGRPCLIKSFSWKQLHDALLTIYNANDALERDTP